MKKLIIVAVVLIVALGGAAAAYFLMQQSKLSAFADAPFGTATQKLVDIPNGTGPKALAQLLADKEVVSSADDLYAWLKREKLGPKLKHGEYEFVGPMTPRQVIDLIVSGKVKTYRFTVAEGLRVDEILPILASSELHLDAAKLKALADNASFVRKLGVPADRLEGFLYPDTYTFNRGATEESVLTTMVKRAIEEYKKASPGTKGIAAELNMLQAMTLASIVEKETAATEERPHISCVFHNRLQKKMKLQTDPTVIYAMMLLRGSYSKNITKKDLETDHPYSTYARKGLPPGPIANPGAAAIQAALHPIDCNDLFFVSMNNGHHVFCPDLKCHEKNVKKFQQGG